MIGLWLACAPKVGPVAVEAAAPVFSAEQLAAGLPAGTVLEFRLTSPDRPPERMRLVFSAPDDVSVDVLREVFPEGATDTLDGHSQRVTWAELSSHGVIHGASVVDRDIDVPAGRFAARCYTLADGPSVTETCFVPALAGPPVLLVESEGGVEIARMELLSRR